MLADNLDLEEAREGFGKLGRCRIDSFLDHQMAANLHETLAEKTEFDIAYADSIHPKLISKQNWVSMSNNDRIALQRRLSEDASMGRGYVYCTYMASRRVEAKSSDTAMLTNAFKFWNSATMTSLIQRVCDIKVTGADCQFTQFTAGQYLTRHRDTIDGNKRKLAFVLSLPRNWHPDWGGLLSFYNESGEITETWIPKFNCLQLFDISQIHGVSAVTPWASEPRYSLTGWFTSQ